MHDIKKPLGYIYMITNTLNGKYYIGSHAGFNPNYMGSGTALKLAFSKYGMESFTKEVLYYCDDFQEHEEQLLIALNAANDPDMYNMVNSGTGGQLGATFSLKSIEQGAAKRRGALNHQYGKPHTAETKAKISLAKTGTKLTLEHRAKLSLVLAGRVNTPEHNEAIRASKLGVPRSEEVRRKISATRLKNGVVISAETRTKISEANQGQTRPRTTCPHCGKTGGANMSRYHFDNCKHAPK